MCRVSSSSRSLHSAACRGYTLLELTVVVTIVSVLAAVALPSLDPAQEDILDLAAGRVASALRFARTESIRTGDVHAVEILFDTEQIIVSQADMTQASPYPPATPTDPASILIDPITKQPLDVRLADQNALAGTDVLTQPFNYDVGDRRTVLFNAQGMPFHKAADTFYRLNDGLVELALGGRQRNVRLDPVTGRVTIE